VSVHVKLLKLRHSLHFGKCKSFNTDCFTHFIKKASTVYTERYLLYNEAIRLNIPFGVLEINSRKKNRLPSSREPAVSCYK
jgi:hypothetical protein